MHSLQAQNPQHFITMKSVFNFSSAQTSQTYFLGLAQIVPVIFIMLEF